MSGYLKSRYAPECKVRVLSRVIKRSSCQHSPVIVLQMRGLTSVHTLFLWAGVDPVQHCRDVSVGTVEFAYGRTDVIFDRLQQWDTKPVRHSSKYIYMQYEFRHPWLLTASASIEAWMASKNPRSTVLDMAMVRARCGME